jgi:AraC-like DNA-binding protein
MSLGGRKLRDQRDCSPFGVNLSLVEFVARVDRGAWARREQAAIRFSDFDALSDTLPGGLTMASPLRGGPFSLEVTGIDLGDVAVRTGRHSPLLVQGVVPDDTAWALLPLRYCGAFLLNGRPAVPDSVAVYGPGATHEGANHGDAHWALMALRLPVVERLLELPRGSPVARPGAHGMLICDPAAWRRAASLLRSAAEVAATDPEVFEVEEARRSLRASVLDASRDLLGGRPKEARYRPPRTAMPSLRRIVRAADDYLVAHPTRALDPAQVAAGLGVSDARLRAAFLAILGVSATRYLMVRRLLLTRAALRATDSRGEPVERIAAAYGFWQLRRFERAYRALFGEMPAAWRNRSPAASRLGPPGGG